MEINSNSIYGTNETMKILGQQTSWTLIAGDGVALKDYENIMEVYSKYQDYQAKDINDLISHIATDFFTLGFIYGERAERAKRNNKPLTPLLP